MRRPELWAELMELTPAERIELVHDLWDSIPVTSLPPLSEDEIEELERRYEEYVRDPSIAITWEELKARLSSRLK
jgi:putative addiction module component (TIGR02574 family)